MNQRRRILLKTSGAAGVIAVATAAGLTGCSTNTFAAKWNKAVFQANNPADALKGMAATTAENSEDIVIKTPEIAENSSVVPIEVTSNIADTQSIAILVEQNLQPMAAIFDFTDDSEPYVGMRLKVTGKKAYDDPWPTIRVIVKADGKNYTAFRKIKTTSSSCG